MPVINSKGKEPDGVVSKLLKQNLTTPAVKSYIVVKSAKELENEDAKEIKLKNKNKKKLSDSTSQLAVNKKLITTRSVRILLDFKEVKDFRLNMISKLCVITFFLFLKKNCYFKIKKSKS